MVFLATIQKRGLVIIYIKGVGAHSLFWWKLMDYTTDILYNTLAFCADMIGCSFWNRPLSSS